MRGTLGRERSLESIYNGWWKGIFVVSEILGKGIRESILLTYIVRRWVFEGIYIH